MGERWVPLVGSATGLRIAPGTLAGVQRQTIVFLALSILAGLGAAWLLEVSWERALYLAPVLVLGSFAVVALVVLWAKVIVETARGSRGERDDSVTGS